MATGIVSIASQLLGMRFVALALYAVNVIVYVALWGLTVARLLRHRQRVIADVFHHGRSVGFFTTVAATCVLGSQSLVVGSLPSLALGLWFAGIVLWAVFTYTIITILTVKAEKPTLADGINGGWLVIVVASHSVAVLGAQLAAIARHDVSLTAAGRDLGQVEHTVDDLALIGRERADDPVDNVVLRLEQSPLVLDGAAHELTSRNHGNGGACLPRE